ncbi:949_t:CDS:2 [Entrophospora sp. SA101]|nr:15683_t:CDS:2 [Entrophospora sp. SA101]CAJ0903341.1 949_t:CDS:2 [Entrophospora sp. SA101]
MPNFEIRTKLRERNINSTGSKSEIKKKLHEFGDNINKMDVSYNQSIDINVLLKEKLLPGFALKGNQKFGKKGGGKHLNVNVVEKLKVMFLQGNIDNYMKMSAEDMLSNLNDLAKENEIEEDDIPTLQQIKSWISRFNQKYKKESSNSLL